MLRLMPLAPRSLTGGSRTRPRRATDAALAVALLFLGCRETTSVGPGVREVGRSVSPASAHGARADALDGGPRGHARSADPWSTPTECERAVLGGDRMERAASTLRLASWNIRWFPHGKPGRAAPGEGTDLVWLACLLVWLDADAVALQEILATEEAEVAMTEVRRLVASRRGGAELAVYLDDCPGKGRQHVAVLVDLRRLRVGRVRSLASLNPAGSACARGLRPGLGVQLASVRGAELELVSVHLDSGDDARAYRHRRASLAALGPLVGGLPPGRGLVVFGDLNLQGCRECEPRISGQQEVLDLDPELRRVHADLRHAGPFLGCTFPSRADSLLDHAIVARVPGHSADRPAQPAGPCSTSCGSRPSTARVSDHCPVVLDLHDG